jgi:hypothetical protein
MGGCSQGAWRGEPGAVGSLNESGSPSNIRSQQPPTQSSSPHLPLYCHASGQTWMHPPPHGSCVRTGRSGLDRLSGLGGGSSIQMATPLVPSKSLMNESFRVILHVLGERGRGAICGCPMP